MLQLRIGRIDTNRTILAADLTALRRWLSPKTSISHFESLFAIRFSGFKCHALRGLRRAMLSCASCQPVDLGRMVLTGYIGIWAANSLANLISLSNSPKLSHFTPGARQYMSTSKFIFKTNVAYNTSLVCDRQDSYSRRRRLSDLTCGY